MTAARASRMSAHTGEPTSITLRCSSGLMLSPMCAPAASISSMWLFSSRVWGSMIWNSSSMPSVNAFGMVDRSGRIVRLEGATP